VDGGRVLRPPTQWAVSLREHLNPAGHPPSLSVESPSPTGRPPLVTGPGVTERRDGPPSGHPHLRPHRRCRQCLACTSCRVVEVPHHHVLCHTCFSKENQVETYMHDRIKFHAYSDIKVNTETVSRKKKKHYQRFTLNPGNEGSKHHRQSTGGCVRLAPATSS
jgi:hypothetical protein